MTKGKVARIETVQLESDSETDPAVRENNGQFILYINLIEAINAGSSDISASRPRSVDVGRGPDDRRADASGDNRATIRCRIMRAGEIQQWASDVVSVHDQLPDVMLVSHLMDQVANRVARRLRERR